MRSKRCHPLGPDQEKKRCTSRFFYLRFRFLATASNCSARPDPNLRFRFFDSVSAWPAMARRGDTFSHPSGSSAWLRPIALTSISNRKERAGNDSGSRLPPARFSWSRSFYHRVALRASRAGTGLAPNPGSPRDPENVQCRAVFIQYQRAVVPRSQDCSRGPTRF